MLSEFTDESVHKETWQVLHIQTQDAGQRIDNQPKDAWSTT